MTETNIDNPHFVASHDFHGDAEYVAWLQEIKGFSSRNLWYMKQWYLFYSGDSVQTEKLHQLGAEMVSPNRVASIIDNGCSYLQDSRRNGSRAAESPAPKGRTAKGV